MKTLASTSLLCRAVRWKLAVVGSDPWCRGHANRCPACDDYYRFVEKLESAARRTAEAYRPQLPPELQQMVRELHRARAAAPRRRAAKMVPFGLATALALGWAVWPAGAREKPLIPTTAVERAQALAAARQNAALAVEIFSDSPELGKLEPDRALARTEARRNTARQIAAMLRGSFLADGTPVGPRS